MGVIKKKKLVSKLKRYSPNTVYVIIIMTLGVFTNEKSSNISYVYLKGTIFGKVEITVSEFIAKFK